MQGGILWPILDHRRLPEKGSLKRSGGPKKSMTARSMQMEQNYKLERDSDSFTRKIAINFEFRSLDGLENS